MEKYDYEIIYPSHIKKYIGHIVKCKNGRGEYTGTWESTIKCIGHKNYKRHLSYEKAFLYIFFYNLDNNLPIRNLIYKYDDRLEVECFCKGEIMRGIFDLSDLDIIQENIIYVHDKSGYKSVEMAINGKPKKITHILMNFTYNKNDDLSIDHINRNSLDNRRSNLRIANHAIQSNNRETVLKCKGIHLNKKGNKFTAVMGIGKDQKTKSYSHGGKNGRTFEEAYFLACKKRDKWVKEKDKELAETIEKLNSIKIVD